MKVLIATGIFPPEIGGPATYAKLLADKLPQRGIEVDVLPFSQVRQYPRLVRHLMYFMKVASRSRKADLIFTQDPVSTGLPVVLAGFLMLKPVVIRVAGDYAWEQARQRFGVTDTVEEFQTKKYSTAIEMIRSIEKFSVSRASAVVTPSNYFSRIVSGWLDNRKKIITIHNGIDINASFEKLPKFETKTIITAGRLIYGKGFDHLIKALSKLPEWKLIIAGDGPDEDKFSELSRQNGVEDRVIFAGRMDRAALFRDIYRSHVFALLSAFETFSFQVVEAMAIGVPVIATNRGGVAEIIEDGVSGILIDPSDIEAFVKNLEKIDEDAALRDRLVTGAKKRAQDFSIDKTIDHLSNVFTEVTAKRS